MSGKIQGLNFRKGECKSMAEKVESSLFDKLVDSDFGFEEEPEEGKKEEVIKGITEGGNSIFATEEQATQKVNNIYYDNTWNVLGISMVDIFGEKFFTFKFCDGALQDRCDELIREFRDAVIELRRMEMFFGDFSGVTEDNLKIPLRAIEAGQREIVELATAKHRMKLEYARYIFSIALDIVDTLVPLALAIYIERGERGGITEKTKLAEAAPDVVMLKRIRLGLKAKYEYLRTAVDGGGHGRGGLDGLGITLRNFAVDMYETGNSIVSDSQLKDRRG